MTIPPFGSGRPAPRSAPRLAAGAAGPPRAAQLAPGPALPAPPDVDGVEAVPLGPVLDQQEFLRAGQRAQPTVEVPGPLGHDVEGELAAGEEHRPHQEE